MKLTTQQLQKWAQWSGNAECRSMAIEVLELREELERVTQERGNAEKEAKLAESKTNDI